MWPDKIHRIFIACEVWLVTNKSCYILTVGEQLGVFARVDKPVGLTVGSDG